MMITRDRTQDILAVLTFWLFQLNKLSSNEKEEN